MSEQPVIIPFPSFLASTIDGPEIVHIITLNSLRMKNPTIKAMKNEITMVFELAFKTIVLMHADKYHRAPHRKSIPKTIRMIFIAEHGLCFTVPLQFLSCSS